MFLFIFGVMFFDLFLLKEMIQCNFSIQFDFIYNSIFFFKKGLILFVKIKFLRFNFIKKNDFYIFIKRNGSSLIISIFL